MKKKLGEQMQLIEGYIEKIALSLFLIGIFDYYRTAFNNMLYNRYLRLILS